MIYRISYSEAAEHDLYAIHLYVESRDSLKRADMLLEGISQAIFSLKNMPERGHCPQELELIGIRDFREAHFKPYRIIYSLHEDEVVVHCVLDGGRDMQTLLQQRLLQ